MQNIECHHCKQKGHIKRFCRKFNKDQKKNKGKEKTQYDSSDDKQTNATEEFHIIYEEDSVNLATQETSWVVDSGATIHVTSRREFFSSYTPGNFGDVRMGNEDSSKVTGKGDVCLETENGT